MTSSGKGTSSSGKGGKGGSGKGKGSAIIITSQPSSAPSTAAPTANPVDPCLSALDSGCGGAINPNEDCYFAMFDCCNPLLPAISPVCIDADDFFNFWGPV